MARARKKLNTPAKITFAIETVKPEMADAWLKFNVSNRPLSRKTVKDYRAAMLRGEWLMNAEAIKFDWNGKLVDGQHRLEAVVQAGIPVQFLVVRNLDPKTFATIDIGKVRSGSDIFALRKIPYPGPMASAYRALFRFLKPEHGKSRVTHTQLLDLIAEHPRMIDLGMECMRSPLDAKVLAANVRIWFFYLAASIDDARARAFMQELAGRGTTAMVASKRNASRVRERLEQTMAEVIPPAPAVKLHWLLSAWNAELAGKRVEKYSRVPTSKPKWDPLPRFGK